MFCTSQQVDPVVVAAMVVPKTRDQLSAVINTVFVCTEGVTPIAVVLFDVKCQNSRDA